MSSLPPSIRLFSAVEWVGPNHPRRSEVEAFIRHVYAVRYGARLNELMPRLLVFDDQRRGTAAVVGLRCGGDGPLFIERYLGAPADLSIEQRCGHHVARRDIVEFGNFAACSPGAARELILSLIPLLQHAGLRFVTFVATRQLRNAFARLGLVPQHLSAADAACLGDDAAQWGRYYDARPEVVFGDIATLQRFEPAPAWQAPLRPLCAEHAP